jgi:hypothetical protein
MADGAENVAIADLAEWGVQNLNLMLLCCPRRSIYSANIG